MKILLLPNDPLSIYIKQGNLEQFIERYRYYADNIGDIYIVNFDEESVRYAYPRIHLINIIAPKNKIFKHISQIITLSQLSRTLKPDVLRIMDGGNFIRGTIGGIAGKITGVPTIISIHGYYVEFSDKFGYKWYHNLIAKFLETTTSVLGSMFLVVDPSYLEKLGWNNMYYIPNYIDCTIFKPIKSKKKWVGIYVGSLHPKKGIKYLLEAVRLVRKKIPNARFAVAGHGPLENEVKSVKGVDYIGPIPYKKLPNYYSQSHMFVTASLWESFCMPAVEAQGCGIPVVGSDLFPFHNNTIPGKTSFLIEIKDPKKLSEEIIKVYNMKINSFQIRSFVLNNFDKEAVLRKEKNLILKFKVSKKH